jgi:hypothetical protein
MRVNFFRKIVIMLLLTSAMAAMAGAQDMPIDAIAPPARGGLHLYNISAYSGWYSNADYSRAPSFSFGQGQPRSIATMGGAVMVGAQRTRETREFWFTYGASYDTTVQSQTLRNHTQFASGGISWRLRPRWALSITGTGADTTAMEALLNPNAIAMFRATPVTIDDLAAAAVSGRTADPLISSYLTGSPFISSNTQLFLFGRRLLSVSSTAALTWSKSPRMKIYFAGVSAAARHVSRREGDTQDRYPTPRSIGGNAGFGFIYDMSPRTQVGLSGNVERTRPTVQDAYIATASASIGHRLNPNWFVYGSIGAGTYAHAGSAAILWSGQIGYQKSAHTLALMHIRTLSDPYGFGVGRQNSTIGTWSCRKKSWLVFASVGRQETESIGFAKLHGWTASSGISRLLNSQLSLQVQQAYLSTQGTFYEVPDRYQSNSVRVSLNWSPNIRLNLIHRGSR